MKEFLTKNDIVAVVGVSSDPQKYGHQVFFDLLDKGYRVYAVHHRGGEVGGHVRYTSLRDLPDTPDVVTTVVSPSVTEEIIKQCIALGIGKVWMQPGSESDEAVALCKKEGIEVMSHMCIMKEEN